MCPAITILTLHYTLHFTTPSTSLHPPLHYTLYFTTPSTHMTWPTVSSWGIKQCVSRNSCYLNLRKRGWEGWTPVIKELISRGSPETIVPTSLYLMVCGERYICLMRWRGIMFSVPVIKRVFYVSIAMRVGFKMRRRWRPPEIRMITRFWWGKVWLK